MSRRKPRPNAPASLSIPSETWLLWGLLYDLVTTPRTLLLIARGQAPASQLLTPLVRIVYFATSAKMTAALILANLSCFAWELHSLASSPAAFARFALRPSDLARGNLLPLVTHVFAHANLAHLTGNLLTLLVMGRVVERHLGPLRMLLAYLGAATVSTALSMAAQVALHQDLPTLGASGAVAGMVALGILLSPLTLTFEALVPMPIFVLGWLSMAADLSGVTRGSRDGIDHFAHLGGYLSVLVIYGLLSDDERQKARTGLLLNLLTLALCLLLYFLFGPGAAPR